MNYYHIVFVKNRIVECKQTENKNLSNTPYYEFHDGLLSFAIVAADNESQARSMAKYIALELKQKNLLRA